MRRYSVIFTLVFAAFLAAHSMAGASLAGAMVPGYLSAKVRQACDECRVYGWTAPTRIDQATLRRLVGAPCDRVKINAIYALGEIRDRQSVGNLVIMLSGPNVHVRRSAAHALGKIGHTGCVEPLAQVMNNPREQILVRCTAARALGRISDLKSVQALRNASMCQEPALARSATQALHGMSGLLFLGSK